MLTKYTKDPEHTQYAPGVTRSESSWNDRYIGRGEALIAAGLITADQLPGQPGRGKIMCTFYAGVQVGKGSNRPCDEHYLQIRRVAGGNIEVIKGIPAEVGKERRAKQNEREELEAKAARAEQAREAAAKRTPDDFREFCLRHTTSWCQWALDGGDGLYPFRFSPEARAAMDRCLQQLTLQVENSAVVPVASDRGAGKAHLRLAWSAA